MISIRGFVAAAGAVAVAASAGLLVAPTADAADPVTETFSYTGGAQTFVVPEGVAVLTIEVFGAQGGAGAGQANGTAATADGGLGGRSLVTFAVTPGDVLQVNVGGRGGDGTDAPSPGSPGFNGGGAGAAATESGTSAGGGGGGGASDVRVGAYTLAERIVVGAGGGGAYGNGTLCSSGCTTGRQAFAGGSGGGATGADGAGLAPGTGGTQASGGTIGGGEGTGAPGVSDTGCINSGGFVGCFSTATGGGGGGRYGGGTASTASGSPGGGAGGGSSSPTTDTTAGVRAGDGLVRITYTRTDPVVVRFTG